MTISSEGFRQANTIVFEAPIMHSIQANAPGVRPENANLTFRDIVDVRGNGQIGTHLKDYDNQIFHPKRDIILLAPQLDRPYSDIKHQAGAAGTEVLTPGDLGNLPVSYPGVHLTLRDNAWQGGAQFVESHSTLNDVTSDVLAGLKGGVGAQWAIDCKTNSVVLFLPRPAPAPAPAPPPPKA